MKQFVNPVFQPLDSSSQSSYHRSEYNVNPQRPSDRPLPPQYDRIFSSETDLSSRLNDSLFSPFDNNRLTFELPYSNNRSNRESYNENLSITQVIDQRRFGQEILRGDDSLVNSSFMGVFNLTTTVDKIQRGYQQIDSIYNKLGDVSDVSHYPKMAQTICDEELKVEMRDKVGELPNQSPWSKIETTPTPSILVQKPPQQQIKYQQPIPSPRSSNTTPQQFDQLPPKPPYITPQQPTYQSRFVVQPYNNEKLEQMKKSSTQQSLKQSQTLDYQSTKGFETVAIPAPQFSNNISLRNSSYLRQNPHQKPEVYYSQLVNQEPVQPYISPDARSSYGLPQELAQHVRKIQSPIKINQPQPMDTQKRFNSNPGSRKHIQVDNQKQLFNQAEKIVQIQRTQPRIVKANWQSKQNVSPTKQPFQQSNQNERANNHMNTQLNNPQHDKELEILCVICEEYIQFEDVDRHSQNCLARSTIINSAQTASKLIAELNNKLESIRRNIANQVQRLGEQNKLNDDLIECILKIISCNKNYKKTSLYTEQLLKMFSQYQQSFEQKRFYTILLVQRALSLSQEKCLKMQFVEQNSQSTLDEESYLMSELSMLDKQAQSEKANLEMWQEQHQMIKLVEQQDLANMKYLRQDFLHQKIDNEVLSQINSDWDVKQPDPKNYQPVTNSVISDINYQKDIDQVFTGRGARVSSQQQISGIGNSNGQSINPNGQPTNSEELKKQFYNLAVQIKLHLPHYHPGKNFLLQDAYDLVIEKKIPKSQWEQFFMEQISKL